MKLLGRLNLVLGALTLVYGCSSDGGKEPDPSETGGESSVGGSSTGGGAGANSGGAQAAAGGASAGGAGGSSNSGGGSSSNTGGAGGTDGGGGSGPSSGGASIGDSGGSSGSGGAPGGACDASLTQANKTLVSTAINELFGSQDLTAIDRYWAEPYLQHNPIADSGIDTFRSLMSSFVTGASFSYERYRIFADCDLVIVHGRYSGSNVVFDMFRVKDQKIMEHWDSVASEASEPSGPSEVSDTELTQANRTLVLDFIGEVLVDGSRETSTALLASAFVEHHDGPTSDPGAFISYVSADNLSYTTIHHVIADGNFVFTLSEGTRGTSPYGFFDLFRIEASQIAEHWDSRRSVPNSTASGLAIF